MTAYTMAYNRGGQWRDWKKRWGMGKWAWFCNKASQVSWTRATVNVSSCHRHGTGMHAIRPKNNRIVFLVRKQFWSRVVMRILTLLSVFSSCTSQLTNTPGINHAKVQNGYIVQIYISLIGLHNPLNKYSMNGWTKSEAKSKTSLTLQFINTLSCTSTYCTVFDVDAISFIWTVQYL